MRMVGGALVMLACGAGCDGGEALASFASGSLGLDSHQMNESQSHDPDTVYIEVRLQTGACLKLAEEATASLNGTAMRRRESGGPQGGFAGGCDSATFTLEFASSALGGPMNARVELRDSSATMVLIATDFLARRELVPRQSISPVSRGQTLVFDWIPPGDRLELEPQISFNPMVNEYYFPAVTRTGSVIQAIVPDDVPLGPTHLQTNVYPTSPVTECSGVDSCDVIVTWTHGEPTTVMAGV